MDAHPGASARQFVAALLAFLCGACEIFTISAYQQAAHDPELRPEVFLAATAILTFAAAALIWCAAEPGRCSAALARGAAPAAGMPPAVVVEELIHLEQQSAARLAGQLHDTAVQSLVVATYLARNGDDDHSREVLADQLMTAERELRDVILGARPPSLTAVAGLGAACEHLHRLMDLREGLAITWDWVSHPAISVPEVTGDLAYRFLLEALSNTARHSGAADAHVTLLVEGNELLVSVQDGGCGFTPPSLQARSAPGAEPLSGLRLISARAAVLGARMSLTTGPGQGTTVTLRCELPTDLEQTMIRIGAAPRTQRVTASSLLTVPTQRATTGTAARA